VRIASILPPAIIAAASVSGLTGASAADRPSWPIELHGRCEYGAQAAKYLDGKNGFARCDTLVIDDRDGAVLDFRQQGFGSVVRYEGKLTGDRMAIARVDLPEKPARKATGTCKIQRTDGRIANVTCTAFATGHLTFSANFVADS
jgi:hypothetical protein